MESSARWDMTVGGNSATLCTGWPRFGEHGSNKKE